MIAARYIGVFIIAVLCGGQLLAQTDVNKPATPANPWAFNLSVSGYDVPHGESFVSPTFTADRDTLHLEARYNYEGLQTGSLWVGYNLSAGKKLVLEVTPMLGGVFGNVNGIAPGLEVTVTYKKLQLYSANEYIFDTSAKAGNFFYTWTQLTYSPVPWFAAGYVVHDARYTAWPAGAIHAQKDYVLHTGFQYGADRSGVGVRAGIQLLARSCRKQAESAKPKPRNA
jgi:hypothetical protein